MFVAISAVLLGACARDPTPLESDSEQSASERAAPSIVPRDASRQAAKLLATIDDRPDCEEYRAAIREASVGSPAAGTTQRAFIEARNAAREADCLVDK